jgi:diaminopropionate ammonia-lyase
MFDLRMAECEYVFNKFKKENPEFKGDEFDFLDADDVFDFHKSLPGYHSTPLFELPGLAKVCGVAKVFVKDESRRFGLNAFKALGASYAIYRVLKERWREKFGSEFDLTSFKDDKKLKEFGEITFCAATDGNHGRAVAWTARMLKQKAVIYMPAVTAKTRIDNIRAEGAKAVLVDGTFDDCVRMCAEDAQKFGWQTIADTAYSGYMDIPKYIVLGYSTLFREMEESIHTPEKPIVDYVFLQAGVGGLAAAGASYYVKRYGKNYPHLICVEPTDSACYISSIKKGDGEPHQAEGKLESIMAGLNCGIPSLIAWPVIKETYDLFLSVSDNHAQTAMREFYRENIISGESGSAGLAGLLALISEHNLKDVHEKLGIGMDSRVLFINTEGDTDPENYKKITGAKF